MTLLAFNQSRITDAQSLARGSRSFRSSSGLYRLAVVAAVSMVAAVLSGGAQAQILRSTGFIYGPPMQGASSLGLNGDVSAKYALAVDPSGNSYITGNAFLGGVGNDWLTIKYNTLGVEQWRATLNGRGNSATDDDARNVRIAPDGNIVVVGSASILGNAARRCTVAKYDAATGRELWRASPGPPTATPAWTETQCFGSSIDSSGNMFVTGRAREQFNFGNGDIYVAKLNSSGNLLWHKTLAPNGAYLPAVVAPATVSAGSDDLAAFSTVDSAGNFYVAARTQEAVSNYVWRIFKLDAAGVQQWLTTVGGTGDSRPRAIAIDSGATRIAIVGTIDGKPGYSLLDASTGSAQFGGAAGVTIGAATSTGFLSDVVFLPGSTTFLVAGSEALTGGTQASALVARIGAVPWQFNYSNGANARGIINAIALTSGGAELAVTGVVGTLPAASNDADLDIVTMRIDVNSGATVGSAAVYQGPAQTSFNTPARDFASAIAVDANGAIYVGATVTNNTLQADNVTQAPRNTMGVGKLNALLAPQWDRVPAAAPGSARLGNISTTLGKKSMALDADGNAYFAARVHTGTSSRTDVIKWNTTAGTETWRCSYDANPTDAEIPLALAVTPTNDVVVAGLANGPQTTNRLGNAFAMKVSNNGATCTVAWTKSLNTGLNDPGSVANAVTTDANGDVFIAGEIYSVATLDAAGDASGNFLVAKLSGANGAELWRYSSDGGSNLEDRAFYIATAPGGVIYVGGDTRVGASAPGDRDWRVIKLQDNGTSVTPVWNVIHNNSGDDFPYAMHLEPSGNRLYLAGYVDETALGTGQGFNMAVRVYSNLTAAAPTLALYTVSGNNNTGTGDFARDVISDAAGNIYLAGLLNNTGVLEEAAVVKLNAAGVEQWRKLLGATAAGNYDEGTAIALTPDGPVITGMFFAANNFELGTAQLRASDGAVMWSEGNNSFSRDFGLAVQTVPPGGSAPAERVVVAGWGGENRSVNSVTGLAKPQTLIVQAFDRASCTLKVDGRNGSPRATTDGLIILRRILTIDEPQAAIGASPTNDIDSRDNLVSTLILRKDYDIDLDGNVDFKDALLIVRYLLGLRGDAVTAGLGLTGGRNQWLPASPTVSNSVKLYLEGCGV